MKTIFFIIGLLIVMNLNAMTKIKPQWDTVSLFLYRNDSVILEPLMICPGTALISNFDEVGTEIYTDSKFDKVVDEFCKEKYIKQYSSSLCMIKIDNYIFIIFLDKIGDSDEQLLTEINKLKNEKNNFINYNSLANK